VDLLERGKWKVLKCQQCTHKGCKCPADKEIYKEKNLLTSTRTAAVVPKGGITVHRRLKKVSFNLKK
jgi:hypothetical protein